jgi:hypothetical protein
MNNLWLMAEQSLRYGQVSRELRTSIHRRRQLLLVVTVFGAFYGLVMGLFGCSNGRIGVQLLYAAVKVPLLLLSVFAVSIPSFFVLNALAGLRRDFGEVLRLLLAAQAVLAINLASLAPMTLLWYCSSSDYGSAVMFNAVMFAIASCGAQIMLHRNYRILIIRNRRHRLMLVVWLTLYALVGIQMAWLLRPFVGNPDAQSDFFRSDAFTQNAYEVILRLIWNVASGR